MFCVCHRYFTYMVLLASITAVCLQGVKHLGSLYCLLVRLLGQSDTLEWRSQWLASPCLYSKLQILLNSLLSSESDYQTPEVEDGWRIICLVLSTKHNDG